MADELRLIFIIIGALVLGALLLHGLWTVRKNAGQPDTVIMKKQQKIAVKRPKRFDDLGVGPVRVVKKTRLMLTLIQHLRRRLSRLCATPLGYKLLR